MITSVVGALLGAAALAYIKTTKIGVWGYTVFAKVLDWFKNKFKIKALDKNMDNWRELYPSLAQKIDDLEKKVVDKNN
jgi:hypothetical protein